uniref:Uncharacterized protein n=1 Tax=Labrus bergylta TaxID=56723 RepID=A0A3Q3ES05_9LABR
MDGLLIRKFTYTHRHTHIHMYNPPPQMHRRDNLHTAKSYLCICEFLCVCMYGDRERVRERVGFFSPKGTSAINIKLAIL